MFGASYKLLVELAKGNGKINDPTVRQGLMKLHTLNELGRMNNLRAKAAKAIGQDVPGLPNISKLSMSEIVRQQRDLGLSIIGPYGTLHAYKPEDQSRPQRGHRQPVRGDGHRDVALRPGARPSTAAPTRCSATSSASACSASPRRPTTTRRPPSRTSPRTPDP